MSPYDRPPRLSTTLSNAGRLVALSACLATCASSGTSTTQSAVTETEPAETTGTTQRQAQRGDAPEISRSVGESDGVLVFWPRVIPSAERAGSRPLSAALQEHLRSLVERALPGRSIDVRPQPERVCPQAGCQAATVGILLLRRGEGCAAVALVSAPGTAPARLVEWAGQVVLNAESVPFREPPEGSVTVRDFARCDELIDEMIPRNEAIAAAIRDVVTGADVLGE